MPGGDPPGTPRYAPRPEWYSADTPAAHRAIHQYTGLPYEAYFALFESIVASVGGRPHWGKMHTLDAGRLRELYPRFGDFVRVRDEADPAGRFTNPYLDRVLGPPPGQAS